MSCCGCCTTAPNGHTSTTPSSKGTKPHSRFTLPLPAHTCPSAPSSGRRPTSNKKGATPQARCTTGQHAHQGAQQPSQPSRTRSIFTRAQLDHAQAYLRDAKVGQRSAAGLLQHLVTHQRAETELPSNSQLTEWLRNQSRRAKSQPTQPTQASQPRGAARSKIEPVRRALEDWPQQPGEAGAISPPAPRAHPPRGLRPLPECRHALRPPVLRRSGA